MHKSVFYQSITQSLALGIAESYPNGYENREQKIFATFNDKCVLIDFLIRFSITGYKVILQIGK